ncbi:MAG TPA: hypothetical protein VEZ59_07280, partial [Sphingopyxis sp.]|nr:hypothetical protein [Sphingopyxis sp.]
PEASRQKIAAGVAAFQNMEMSDNAEIFYDSDGLVSHAMLTRSVGNTAGEAATETTEIRRTSE